MNESMTTFQIHIKNVAIAELESTMSDKDDLIVDLEAQLAETEQFLEQVTKSVVWWRILTVIFRFWRKGMRVCQ